MRNTYIINLSFKWNLNIYLRFIPFSYNRVVIKSTASESDSN